MRRFLVVSLVLGALVVSALGMALADDNQGQMGSGYRDGENSGQLGSGSEDNGGFLGSGN